jgi:MbtH protein
LETGVTNPFEDPDASYIVLINDEGQHSLWPLKLPVPIGWSIVHTEDSLDACLEYMRTNWTDMRPRSLVEAMAARDAGASGEAT